MNQSLLFYYAELQKLRDRCTEWEKKEMMEDALHCWHRGSSGQPHNSDPPPPNHTNLPTRQRRKGGGRCFNREVMVNHTKVEKNSKKKKMKKIKNLRELFQGMYMHSIGCQLGFRAAPMQLTPTSGRGKKERPTATPRIVAAYSSSSGYPHR